MSFSRHEWRYIAVMALLMTNIAVTGIIGMAVGSAVEVGQTPVVPRNIINAWAWFSIFASPLVMVAGMIPAGKDDLLKWN